MRCQQSSDNYKIKLNFFEGPLDLLLHLIKREKIDIYDIPIAEITEQYLDYIRIIQDLNLDIASDFLLMASYLIFLKSKSLLNTGLNEESDMDIEESKRLLTQRLIEYQTFKKAAEIINKCELDHSKHLPSHGIPNISQELIIEADLIDLLKAYYNIIERENIHLPKIHKVVIDPILIKQEISRILSVLRVKKSIFFRLLLKNYEKDHLVYSFLAVLELVKTQRIKIIQGHQFGEITINSLL